MIKMLLIDGNSYLKRNYHGRPESYTSLGIQRHAIIGTYNMIVKDFMTYQPDLMGIVFDDLGTNFRHEIYPEYKEGRDPKTEEFINQYHDIKELLSAKGFPVFSYVNVEADDVMGTIAKRITSSEKLDCHVLISTRDKDMCQIVNDKISLVDTQGDNHTFIDEEYVKNKFGVNPNQIIDYLTLIGDRSDNLKFLSGCGKKTALKLINEYGTLENIFNRLETTLERTKILSQIEEKKDKLLMCKKLITLLDMDVKLSLSMFKKKNENLEHTKKFSSKYENNF